MLILSIVVIILNSMLLTYLTEYFEQVKVRHSVILKYVAICAVGVILGTFKDFYIYALNYNMPMVMSLAFVMLVFILLLYVLYTISLVKIIIITVIFSLVTLIPDIITVALLFVFMQVTGIKDKTLLSFAGMFISFCILLFLIVVLKGRWKDLYLNVLNVIQRNSKKKSVVYVLQIFFPLALISAMGLAYMDIFRQGIVLTYSVLPVSVLLVGYLVYCVLATNAIVKDKLKVYETEQQAIYAETYKYILEDVKDFWHGYTNLMQAIQVCLQQEANNGSESYKFLQDLVERQSEVNLENKVQLTFISHPVIAGVLATKLTRAQSLGVKMYVKSIGSSVVNMNMADLVDVLGVLLDNALEVSHFAASKCVDVSLTFTKSSFDITIFNYLKKENGVILKYGESNKIGLKAVDKIISKSTNITKKVQETEQFYMVSFTVNKD